jgi:orotate phosphoribosyltransferase
VPDLASRIHRVALLTGTFRLRSGATSSRRARKDYGTCRVAEGMDVAGRRLAVIEDIATTGGQMVESIEELRREGARVDAAPCVIDREAGAVDRLSSIGVRLAALFRMSELP